MPQATITEAVFIDAPRDADLQALYEYWETVRGDRAMPQRSDIDPCEIPKLLPCVIMYDVGGGNYSVRLMGGEIERFVGRNITGRAISSFMSPRATEVMVEILDAVATERVPKFRAGKAHWLPEKAHRDFEACFLPLSADGESVNIILGGIKFPLG